METWQTIQDGANTRNNRFEKKLCIGYQKNTKKIILLTLSWSLLLTLNCFIPPLEFSFHLCPSLKTCMTSRGAYQPSEIWGIICAQFSVLFLFMFTFYQVGFLHSLLIFEVFLLITRDQFKCCSYMLYVLVTFRQAYFYTFTICDVLKVLNIKLV